MASKTEFDRIWQALARAYPGFVKDLSGSELEGTFQIYERLLSDIPVKVLEAAVLQHIASSKWFPTVAEIRQGTLALVVTPRPTAMEAWGKVVNAFGRSGTHIMPDGNGYQPPEWDDPITAHVVESMGWRELCNSTNMEADRAHFMRAYDVLVQRERDDALVLPIVRDLAARLSADRERKQIED